MAKPRIHVVPHDDGWAVKREGASKASVVCDTKADAMDAGRDQAKTARTELVEHDRHGRIANSNSYGNDPFPPRDMKH
jgi:hypothetical protein